MIFEGQFFAFCLVFFNVTKNKQYSENYLMLNADAIADIYKSARDIFESVRDIFRKYESARDNCP